MRGFDVLRGDGLARSYETCSRFLPFVLRSFLLFPQCRFRHMCTQHDRWQLMSRLFSQRSLWVRQSTTHSWRNLNVKRLLCNVTKNTVFTFNNRLHRQIDGCRMGNPLSPVLANIFMAKLEEDVVRPYHPPFYDRYVDDCFSKKVENETDRLLDIKFTVEEKPNHFLNTAYNYQDQNFHRRVYRIQGNVLTHWSSQVPFNWKRNRMMGRYTER